MNLERDDLTSELRRLVGQATRQVNAAGPADAGVGLVAVLRELVDACVVLFEVSGCGLMLADEQNITRYVAASDGPGRQLETFESRHGEGPCTEAFVNNLPVTTDDLMAEGDRWPHIVAGLRATPGSAPVHALIGVPIRLGGVTVGTIDIYRDRPHRWSDQEVTALVRYGVVISTTLAAALQAHTSGQLAAQLQYALDYRIVIERGVGYLMARDGVGAVTAFDRIRRTARSGRVRVDRVAEHLLATGRLEAVDLPTARPQPSYPRAGNR